MKEFFAKLFRRPIIIRMDAIEQEGMWQQRYAFKKAENECLRQTIERMSRRKSTPPISS